MRKITAALTVLCLVALFAAPADAGKRHNHKPSGVKGVVIGSTGLVNVTVARASDGMQVASQTATDGHFGFRLPRGVYDVSSVPPVQPVCPAQPQPVPQAQQICPPPCTPTAQIVCPLASTPAVIVAPCVTGETKRVRVRGHRFTHVELHVTNVCVVEAS